MNVLRLKNGANEKSEWKDDRMKGLLNHACLNPLTKGAHRHCLCDLKATTQLIHSVPIISAQSPAAWAVCHSYIPAWYQSFIWPYISGSLWRERDQDPYYPCHNAPTWTSNTFLWFDGSIMQSQAPFRSITWALLFMTCFWCKISSSAW